MATNTKDIFERVDVLRNVLDHVPVNVMVADHDENIVYVNKRAERVLTDLEEELSSYLPGFKAEEVVGGSIHRYHRDAGAIQGMLTELKSGEVKQGQIRPGHFVFDHETRALEDEGDKRLGYIVQWHDVTQQHAKEEEAARLLRAIDDAQTAMMMIDRDLQITYANKATMKLLKANEQALRSLYPSFSADSLIGTCIDIFHANPAHQRKLLGDPGNLPYETDIHVGPLTFHICVNPITDLEGAYIGNTLEWADVTDLRAKEKEVARLQSAVDGASTALMLCDEDLTISYVNASVVELLRERQEALRKVFPGFDVDNLVGKKIDGFHKNPEHQRALLQDPSRLPHKAEIALFDLTFEVNATAIIDSDGKYCGNMVEWKDLTEQKDAERQIQSLIEAAGQGELGQRIDVSHYVGFMKSLGSGINGIMEAVEAPVGETIRVAKAMADGDLTQLMAGTYQGEFSELQNAINSSVEKLCDVVQQISTMASNVKLGSGEISSGNFDLSQRTEEQSASLEETASSMEEMTETVKQNADNATLANQMATSARDQAESGGQVVRSAVEAMSEINKSSKRIEDIISVIDEIAFQTNILALNAAVEAARAGEQGRGFAVVAAEVRTLAQRSAGAAKEIKGLIKDSLEKVEEGGRLVDGSGQALEEIVTAVKKVSEVIAEIAAAGEEQASGIEQVNKAVAQLDEVTQQNAALVEQSSTASQSLSDQAVSLEKLVEFFYVGDQAKETASAPAPKTEHRAAGRGQKAEAGAAERAKPQRKAQPAAAAEGEEWESF